MSCDMTTTFIDTVTGEEYEFLGTSIQFSERELITLEQQRDAEIDAIFVQQLIDSGYFDEEWDHEVTQQSHVQSQDGKNGEIEDNSFDKIVVMDDGETSNEETSESESDVDPYHIDGDETDDGDDEENENQIIHHTLDKPNKCIIPKDDQCNVQSAESKHVNSIKHCLRPSIPCHAKKKSSILSYKKSFAITIYAN